MLRGKAVARIVSLVSILLVVLLIAACGPKNPIVGKWQSEEGITFEFTGDGKLIASFEGMTMEGTYTVEGNMLKIEVMGESPEAVEFKVEGDTLSIIETGGETTVLNRTK